MDVRLHFLRKGTGPCRSESGSGAGTARALRPSSPSLRALTLPLLLLLVSFSVTAQTAATPNPERTFVGEVLEVDAARSLVTVGESIEASAPNTPAKKRERLVLTVDGSTQVLRGKKPATVAEIRPKDHAVVRYVKTAQGLRATSMRVAEGSTPAPFVQ